MKKEDRDVHEEKKGGRSKRKYPEKLCFNPNCEFEKKFIPHDRRQKFCCEQCRINFHNDKQHGDNNSSFRNEKLLRQYDKKLEKIYYRCVDKDDYCIVWKGILEYEGINVRLLVEEQQNTHTGEKVKWFYRFGTELDKQRPDFFTIYKKTKK